MVGRKIVATVGKRGGRRDRRGQERDSEWQERLSKLEGFQKQSKVERK